MRHLRITFALAVTACALAVAAAPAMAHEFTASTAGKTKGVTEEAQKFTLGPFKITCLKTASKGLVTAGSSPTFTTVAKFSKCSTEGRIGGKKIEIQTVFKTPFAIEYFANRVVEIGSETEEVEGEVTLSGGEIALTINAGPKFKCKIFIEPQKLPAKLKVGGEGTAFSVTPNWETLKPVGLRFPDGRQHKLEFHNEFKAMHYLLEGEPCEEWGKEEGSEAFAGKYTGVLPEELGGGNLDFS